MRGSPTDSPAFIRNASWSVVERYIDLPGNVVLTIRPGSSGNANKVYSLPNIHGDIFATTDANGTLTGSFAYDPFGNQVSATKPGNMWVGATLSWVGAHQRITEKDLTLQPINMGARGYIPKLGSRERFSRKEELLHRSLRNYKTCNPKNRSLAPLAHCKIGELMV